MTSVAIGIPRLSLCRVGWILTVVLACVSLAAAQDDLPESGIEYPLQIIHCAGVDRIQEKADAIFLAADRPEMSDVMQNWMDTSLRGLKGMDRTKPFGMLIYIKPGLTPGISAISYLPVADIKEFLAFLAGENGVVKETTGGPWNYEITEVDWGPDLAIKQVGDYAFMTALDEDASALNRRFPSPERLVSKLTSRFDLAYSLLLKNIPPATKTIFFEFFKNQALAGLQQRDGEPDAAYEVRRANGEALVDLVDMIVSQGEELTLGGFANLEDQTAFAELEINGTKDSKLAKFLQNLAGRRSYFDPAVSESATFTLNASVQLDEKRRKPFTVLFSSAVGFIEDALKPTGKADATAAPTARFFESLRNTAEDGHLDVFVQLSGEKPREYRLLGGLRVLAVGNFPEQLRDTLEFVKKTAADNNVGNDILAKLELHESTIEGHPVHLLPLPTPPDEMGQSLFGETPNLYLCATPQAIWFAVGSDTAKEQLSSHLRAVAAGPSGDAPKRPASPLLITTHASHWIDVGLAAGANPEEDKTVGASIESFTPDNDELRLTGRPTDNGGRVRAELQSGYFSWIGRLIAQQVDSEVVRSQERLERRRARGGRGNAVPAAPQ